MPREMPPAGYYVRQKTIITTTDGRELPPQDSEIIYTTGVRGGGGHKYCRDTTYDWDKDGHRLEPDRNHDPLTTDPSRWWTLRWSCVPSKKTMEKDYHWAATLEEARELLRTLPYNRYP